MPDLPEDDELPFAESLEEAPPRPMKPPGPGFWEAVLWCLLFLVVLHGGTIATAVGAWLIEGIATGNLQTFLKAEQAGLDDAAKASQAGRPLVLPPGLSDAIVWGMLIGQIGGLLFVLLLIRLRIGKSWRPQLAFRRPPLALLGLALLATPGLMVLHGGVHELVHAAFGQKPDDDMSQMLRAMFVRWPAWFAVIVIGICPGVLEELFCRGFLGRGLLARYGLAGGVLRTSVLFGFLHILPLYAIGTIFMGIGLHVAYIATRSLWVPMLIHGFNNAITILATMGTVRIGAAEQDAASLDAWVYVAAGASVAFLFAALWTGRVRLAPIDPRAPAWTLPYPGVGAPPPGANGVLVAGRPNALAVLVGLIATGGLLYLIFG